MSQTLRAVLPLLFGALLVTPPGSPRWRTGPTPKTPRQEGEAEAERDIAAGLAPGKRSPFFRVEGLPDAVLDLPFRTYEDYLKSLKLKARRNIRSKTRKVDAEPTSEVLALPLEEQYAFRAKQGLPAPLVEIRAVGESGEAPWDGLDDL